MRMKLFSFLLATPLLFPHPAQAQGPALFGDYGPKLDLNLGFQRIQANAPPGQCQCFGANGGFASANWWLRPRLGITGEFTGTRATNISSLGQNLTLMTFMAGPHVAYPISRLAPFAEVLFGATHGSDSYFPTGSGYQSTATSFALAAGGGIDFNLSDRWSIRAVQARYLHSTLPNGTSNEQNELMIGAGVVLHLGNASHRPRERSAPPAPEPPAPEPAPAAAPPPPPPPPPMVTAFDCTAAAAEVQAGNTLEVASILQTTPSGAPANIGWTASGGRILGEGTRITVDTTSLPPGEYHVTGRAQLGEDTGGARTCDVTFHVVAPPPPAPTHEDRERDFREHVHDVFFDLNKATLRPAALITLQKNADYLKEHPEIRIIVQGYADERGSSKYNLALGERRVQAVRDELVRLGIGADRMQVLTFGHDAQACTASTEQCWQKNRRVGFLMQP